MKKKIILIMASISLMLFIVACSSNSEESKTVEDTEPVELTVYVSGWTHERFMEYFGDFVQEKYPNVSFNVLGGDKEVVSDLIASGVKLDLIQSSAPNLILDNGLEDDVTDLIRKYNYDLNQLMPEILEYIKSIGDGKIYGFTNGIATTGLYFDKDIFDKFGVPYPTNGMTWDEVFELAKVMTRTDGDTEYQGFVEYISLMISMNQMSQGLVDPKTNKALLNNENWQKLIENFARFHTIPGNPFIASPHDIIRKEHRAAMHAGQLSAAIMTTYTDAGINWGVVSLPELSGFPGNGPGAIVPLFYIGKTAEHRDWAFKVASFFGTEEYQKQVATQFGVITAMKNYTEVMSSYALNVPKIPADKNAAAALPKKYAKIFTTTPYDALVSKELQAAYGAVANGELDVNTALREAEERANIAIEAAMANK